MNQEGHCIHHIEPVFVEDTTGYRQSAEEPRYGPRVDVFLTSETRPDGREASSPMVYVDGREMTVSQALALAETIKSVVRTYRNAGGRE